VAKAKKEKPAPAVLWPRCVQARYGVCAETRWRWEREGKLPARDVYMDGKAVAWRVATIEAAERRPGVAA